MAAYIEPVEPTPQQLRLIDALASTADDECATPLEAATMLFAAASKLLFRSLPPRQAVQVMDEVLEGGRQAVREAMN